MKNVCAAFILTFCLIATPVLSASAHEQGTSAQSSPQATQQSFDIQFLDTMVKHHEEGIKMFEMAADKSKDSAVKAMAEKMAQDQKNEIPELQALRNEIDSDAPKAVNMNMPGMMPMEMSKLEKASGAQFDREFLSMTIEHHKGAIKMADMALQKSQNADVKTKAQSMHDKQKDEVMKMEKMLQDKK